MKGIFIIIDHEKNPYLKSDKEYSYFLEYSTILYQVTGSITPVVSKL